MVYLIGMFLVILGLLHVIATKEESLKLIITHHRSCYLRGNRGKFCSWRQFLYNRLSPIDKGKNEKWLCVDTCIRQKQK